MPEVIEQPPFLNTQKVSQKVKSKLKLTLIPSDSSGFATSDSAAARAPADRSDWCRARRAWSCTGAYPRRPFCMSSLPLCSIG